MVETASSGMEAMTGTMPSVWSSWPLTAKICMLLATLQVAACLITHCSWQAGPAYKAINEDEIEIFTMARNALIIPMALITLVAGYQLAEMYSPQPRHRALVISRVSMFEFAVKICYYTMLSRGYGLAFQNQRSYDYRPIYVTRWLGWTYAVPTMIFMNLYPVMDNHRALDVVIRLFPQMAASAAYCWACGLGCIVFDPLMGWFLNTLGCVAYVAVIADEIVYVRKHIGTTSQPLVKGASIIIKEIMFVIYTAVFLLGNWGVISSYACQLFYSVSDISHLGVMSTLLFVYWNVDDPKLTGAHKD